MTTKEKLITGAIMGIVLYGCSMYDGRAIYDPEKLIDCRVGKYIFTVKKLDCIGTIEYAVTHPKRLITHKQVRVWWLYYRQQQADKTINN